MLLKIFNILNEPERLLGLSRTEKYLYQESIIGNLQIFLECSTELDDPELISNKFQKLMQIISRESQDDHNGLILIFVQKRNLAKWLSYYINEMGTCFALLL